MTGTDLILERRFEPPLTVADVYQMAAEFGGCMDLYRVVWRESLLSGDGSKMWCRFAAPDAEALRNALRHGGAQIGVVWPTTLHEVDHPPQANVLVERRFATPVTLEEIQAIEDAGAWCLESHRVKFARTFFSRDRKRMICLYQAPDAESVRLAQRQAEVPFEQVWSFTAFHP